MIDYIFDLRYRVSMYGVSFIDIFVKSTSIRVYMHVHVMNIYSFIMWVNDTKDTAFTLTKVTFDMSMLVSPSSTNIELYGLMKMLNWIISTMKHKATKSNIMIIAFTYINHLYESMSLKDWHITVLHVVWTYWNDCVPWYDWIVPFCTKHS